MEGLLSKYLACATVYSDSCVYVTCHNFTINQTVQKKKKLIRKIIKNKIKSLKIRIENFYKIFMS